MFALWMFRGFGVRAAGVPGFSLFALRWVGVPAGRRSRRPVFQASGLAGAVVALFYKPAGTPTHLRATPSRRTACGP
ncbi:hypothetical protein GCM10023075_18090 [Streptosporangium album]